MQTRLIEELGFVGRRIRKATQLTVLAAIWLVFFITAWCLSLGYPLFGLSPALSSLIFLGVSLVMSILFCVISRNWFSDLRWLASRVESRYPELDSRLLTSLDQFDGQEPVQVGFLQHMVVMQTIGHSARNRWDLVVSPSKLVFSQLAAVLAFGLMLIGSIMIANGRPTPQKAIVAIPDQQQNVVAGESAIIELLSVEPGNTEVEKGTALTVLAKFKSAIPEKAELIFEFVGSTEQETGPNIHRISMSPSFDDPVFAGQIEGVRKPLTYWVEYEDKSSERYYANVFEYPELKQLDFTLDFPEYTGLPDKTINDGRRVSALKGTKVQVVARLNKTVDSCQLVPMDSDSESGDFANEGNQPIDFVPDPNGGAEYRAELIVQKTVRYQLKLIDSSGRSNKIPPEVQINALDNNPPKIKITSPARDVEVSPLEELGTAAKVSDDYGVSRTGVSFSLAGTEIKEVVLLEKLIAKKEHDISHQLNFEEMDVSPRQMVSYFFWAEDLVEDGKSRRVMSDMFFAEVRDFDKIFRQGQSQNQQQRQQQQQQQSQQQQQQNAELRQLQKEIINATWKLIRRETDESPSDLFDRDVGVIQESQQSAIELVDRAVQQQNRPEAAALGTQIKTAMNDVILTLQTARSENSVVPLVDAVTKEQLVYQLILKMGANESQVQQQQQSSSSSSSSGQSRSQQQLQQLQLSNDRNRYEQENQANQQQEQQNSEVRQALNRLKELAQRQEDINKQLEQLQTALEEAKTEEEKEEIERRLKRLREQQEELLRDLDELKEQAETNSDNELMQKANEELEKARENVRRSSEALKNNEVSQAAAAGNRAQQQFEDLRDEFRKNNANQFSDDMKAMSEQASELKTKQDDIANRLKQMDEDPKKSLRENEDRQKVANELIQQRQKYDSILEDIKDVVRKAEESEPLLSQKLYETFRDTSKSQTRDSINATENLLSRGFVGEARKSEEAANEGISNLNDRIQQAAESIVGDEAESLRRAEKTLRKLSDQINKEIGENTGQTNPSSENQNQDPSKQSKAGSQPGNKESSDSKQDPSQGAKSKGGKTGDSKSKSPSKGDTAKGDSSKESKQGEGKGGKGDPGKGNPGKENSKENNEQKGSGKGGGQGKQPGKNDPSQQGSKQPGKNPGQAKSGEGSKGGQGKTGGKAGDQPGKGDSAQNRERPNGNPRTARNNNVMDGFERMNGGSTGGAPRPITGDQYRQFSNQLREIEELLDDPELSARAAEIREKAKEIRVEMKRHSKQPNWDVVQEFIAEPLDSLRAEVARRLLLKENREALVPIDRDPVPTIFENQVQQYFKELSEIDK